MENQSLTQIKTPNNGISDKSGKTKTRKAGRIRKILYSALIGLSTLMPISTPQSPNKPTSFKSQEPLLSSTLRADEGNEKKRNIVKVDLKELYGDHIRFPDGEYDVVDVENAYFNPISFQEERRKTTEVDLLKMLRIRNKKESEIAKKRGTQLMERMEKYLEALKKGEKLFVDPYYTALRVGVLGFDSNGFIYQDDVTTHLTYLSSYFTDYDFLLYPKKNGEHREIIREAAYYLRIIKDQLTPEEDRKIQFARENGEFPDQRFIVTFEDFFDGNNVNRSLAQIKFYYVFNDFIIPVSSGIVFILGEEGIYRHATKVFVREINYLGEKAFVVVLVSFPTPEAAKVEELMGSSVSKEKCGIRVKVTLLQLSKELATLLRFCTFDPNFLNMSNLEGAISYTEENNEGGMDIYLKDSKRMVAIGWELSNNKITVGKFHSLTQKEGIDGVFDLPEEKSN
jgi:hypothetical protein